MSLRLFGFGLQREITFLGSYLGTLYTLRCFYHIVFRCQVAVAFERHIVRCDLKGEWSEIMYYEPLRFFLFAV